MGTKEEPKAGVILTSDDYAKAFVPFYSLKTEIPVKSDFPEWARKRRDTQLRFLNLLPFIRLCIISVVGFNFAKSCCGKARLVQIIQIGLLNILTGKKLTNE
jgi:hypothetical protein